MLLHEIFSLFKSLDHLLSEGFKDDMFKQYPEDVENKDFKAAITAYNSDPKLKEALKHAVKPQGNIAVSIKRQYPTAADFVNLINSLISNAKDKEEYKQLKQGTASAGETDYWMIPCRTFKELHEAAFKYVGNLPRLTKEEITNKYGIDTPEPMNFYKTDKTPAEFLEYMKNEDKFFMAPTWCVAANEDYFYDYNLETYKNEKPRCYIFISKKYPNVRFCVTLKREKKVTEDILYKEEKIKISSDTIGLGEVRDPWQIGGGTNVIKTGLEMMRLAFGPKIDKVIEDIRFTKIKMKPFSELEDGKRLFFKSNNIPSISSSFDNLVNGYEMFKDSDFEKINCNFPVLKNAYYMFDICESLSEFTGDLPKLSNAEGMFFRCTKLKKFECKNLSELENGKFMFDLCELLEKFECDLPKLKNGKQMFYECKSLESFNSDLSSLEKSDYMFLNSGIKTFKSNLPKLNAGKRMFYGCKNLERFDTPLPKLEDGEEMFSYCKNLKLFNSELLNLKYGESMFAGCENLTRFKGNLSSLEYGYGMFRGCKLDTESVKNIAETITKSDGKVITIGIDEMDEEKKKYIEIIKRKGWKVEIK